jgi:hypothetical protein
LRKWLRKYRNPKSPPLTTTISNGVVVHVKQIVAVPMFHVVIESIVVGVSHWMILRMMMMNITTRTIPTATTVEDDDRKRNVRPIKVTIAAVPEAIIMTNDGIRRILNIIRTKSSDEVVRILMTMLMLNRPVTIVSMVSVSRPVEIKT